MHVQLGDKQNKCTMHHSTEHDICFRTHTLEKVDQLCTCTTVTCHPCLVLHHYLNAIDLANACQWPLEWSSFHYTSPLMFRNHACHVGLKEGNWTSSKEGNYQSDHIWPHVQQPVWGARQHAISIQQAWGACRCDGLADLCWHCIWVLGKIDGGSTSDMGHCHAGARRPGIVAVIQWCASACIRTTTGV